ncbi:MAG TPA: serine O-acetyltransferase [Limnochordia bacterium]|jgi:serine O-acetyltransferase|nr:serine O-acetyltransferase [Bacillota bacterium]HKM16865.1 serine O-acetyltransferase [Limnochordia bacterium]
MFGNIIDTIRKDIQAIKERDPAARNTLEIVLTYPGLHALEIHRIAHWLHRRKLKLLARIISHLNRFFTGIEIHPGAQIGRGVFIDHGMGVVIGETTVIKDNVTLYQGVVLGGTGKEKDKRHPTIEQGAVIASGAMVLGSFTVGENARVGAGAVVLNSVPPNSTVVGVPAKVVIRDGQRVDKLDHVNLPDPCRQQVAALVERIETLEEQIAKLQYLVELQQTSAL